MTALIVLGLALPTLAFLLYPLVKQGDKPEPSKKQQRVRELLTEREVATSFVEETELDREMGKLSEEDQHSLSTQYKGEASELRNEILRLQGKAKRSQGKPAVEDEIEKQVRALRQSAQRRNKRGDKVCPRCGAKRTGGGQFCAQCDAKQPEGDTR